MFWDFELAMLENNIAVEEPEDVEMDDTNEIEEEKYIRFIASFRDPGYQQSIIKLHSPAVRFNDSGNYFDDFQIETFGYWAFERLADQLPFDFVSPYPILLLKDFK